MARQSRSTKPRPVTMAVTRRVRDGLEPAFEEWVRGISDAAQAFPGHIGVGVLRPPAGSQEYVVIFRFDSEANYRLWHRSSERKRWLERVRPLIEGKPVETFTPGLEFWFTPSGAMTLRNPPRWKMVLVTLAGLLPLSFALNLGLAPWLRTLLPPVAVVVVNALILVPTMTYLVMPALTGWLKAWLEPD